MQFINVLQDYNNNLWYKYHLCCVSVLCIIMALHINSITHYNYWLTLTPTRKRTISKTGIGKIICSGIGAYQEGYRFLDQELDSFLTQSKPGTSNFASNFDRGNLRHKIVVLPAGTEVHCRLQILVKMWRKIKPLKDAVTFHRCWKFPHGSYTYTYSHATERSHYLYNPKNTNFEAWNFKQ